MKCFDRCTSVSPSLAPLRVPMSRIFLTTDADTRLAGPFSVGGAGALAKHKKNKVRQMSNLSKYRAIRKTIGNE